ncbi:MAG TPA: glycosyltransferase family 4 protein [Solirubrobacterales bacterium]|nr:glycosyltransferase family 4 protein [Solirubrobacterales bacterium]
MALRVLVIDEGVLGHRTLKRQLEASLAGQSGVETTFVTVPPPSRLGRLWLRRWGQLGDADLHGLRWRLRWSWQARRLLVRHRREADVALIVTQASALLMRGPMRRTPCVLSIDATVGQFTALEYQGPAGRGTGLQLRLIARLERRALRGAAALMPWTEWNADALREEYGIEEGRIATLHPGLDAGWWSQAAAERRRREPAGPLRVLFVGNDVERKGLPTLVEAVGQLGGEAVLDVVSGDEVPAHDHVELHRGVESGTDRLRQLYAGADVFALPTRADAVPWAVLEAMAAGLPVVASAVGSIPELVGETGELVPPGDPEALAAALRRLRDPERRRSLGEQAEARISERYDSALQTQRLLTLLRTASPTPMHFVAHRATNNMEDRGELGALRMRRRTFVAVGAGAIAVAVAVPYLELLPGEEFEQLVASRLGIEEELAEQLLARAKEEYGEAEYDARATAFALAVRDPAAAVMPADARRKAIDGLLAPMLSGPTANLAYAVTGSDPGSPACAGLVRSS